MYQLTNIFLMSPKVLSMECFVDYPLTKTMNQKKLMTAYRPGQGQSLKKSIHNNLENEIHGTIKPKLN